jgi:hypothetical protein
MSEATCSYARRAFDAGDEERSLDKGLLLSGWSRSTRAPITEENCKILELLLLSCLVRKETGYVGAMILIRII